jgi:hypothetical protein
LFGVLFLIGSVIVGDALIAAAFVSGVVAITSTMHCEDVPEGPKKGPS